MILFLIIHVLSYRQVFNVKPEQGMHYFPFHFGFNKGGQYSINVLKGEDSDLLFLIATEDDIKQFKDGINQKNICNSTNLIDYMNLIHVKNGKGFASGTIGKKGKYSTTITICKQLKYNYSVLLTYSNPNSLLSYDEQPCVILEIIFSLIICFIFIRWLINWYTYFSMKNILHTLITICLFATLVYDILYAYEYYHRSKSDEKTKLSDFMKIFQFLHVTIIVATVFLLSKGLSIIYKNVSFIWYILAFVISSIATIPWVFLSYTEIEQSLFNDIMSTTVTIYLAFLISNFVNTRNVIMAHMCIIAETGIDPRSTPINLKLSFFYLSFAILFEFAICGALYKLFRNDLRNYSLVLYHLFINVLELFMINHVTKLFQVTKMTYEGYMIMSNEDEEDGQIFDVTQLDQIYYGISYSSLNNYEEGMVLPPQPKLNKTFFAFCYI